MHPIRQSILDILKRDGQATVSELAEQLAMAPVSVRHHLDLLIGDNLVSTPLVRRAAGAGRPQQIYALTNEASSQFPNNYRQLAGDSLQALKDVLPREQVMTVMREMARRTAAQISPKVDELPVMQRAAAIVSYLNDLGYMAEFEMEAGAVVLHTCNCPYSELASQHPELCFMDATLVAELAGAEPQRVAHISEGDGRCSYQLHLQNGAQTASVISLISK